ncbi:MAG: YdcH family protein [Sphingobium sp.]|nr:YdcH family protein [Sphingobium sp.]
MSKLIFRLMSRHQQIDTALRREQARRLPDFARLQRLKKLKLAIKDRLVALTTRRRVAPQG